MTKTGTREWAENSVNVCTGCSHNCIYCYAAEIAARFKRRDRLEWHMVEVHPEKVVKLEGKHFIGRVMIPTTHDIVGGAGLVHDALYNLLSADNDVVVVTKAAPWNVRIVPDVYRAVCELGIVRYAPEVRMSITCMDDAIAEFWEPGAARPVDRRKALIDSMAAGLPTSVSAEPLLEPDRAMELVDWVSPYCHTDEHGRGGEIWIGKCNHLTRRTKWAVGRVPGIETAVRRLEAGQTTHRVLQIYHALREHPMVRWKDSYKAVLKRHGIDVGGKRPQP